MQPFFIRLLTIFCVVLTTKTVTIHAFHIDNFQATKTVASSSHEPYDAATHCFSEIQPSFTTELVATSPLALQQAAKDTLRYIKNKKQISVQALEPSYFKDLVTKEDVIETLKFIIKIIEEDKKTGLFRILDPTFIATHFRVIQWQADRDNARAHNVTLPSNGNIRLTNYAVYNVTGSRKKTKKYNCALYQLHDESIRTKFTKHQILYGALEKPHYQKKVTPLAWVTRDDFEQALLQGTVLVNLPNKTYKIFIVSSNNGIAYNKSIKIIKKQKRYWFFKEAKKSLASLKDLKKRIKGRKEVVFAGDIHNLGIGKLIAIKHINQLSKKQELYLGILADTGGAFVNNLYQLDFFAGIFNSVQDLKKYVKKFPLTTQAYLLCKQ